MTTEWTSQFVFFMRLSDLSASERETFARAFSDNDSGEREADEEKMFDSAPGFSADGLAPAVVLGISTAVKPAILTALLERLDIFTSSLWYEFDNRTGLVGRLLDTNDAGVTVTSQRWSWAKSVERLEAVSGLEPIIPDEAP